MAVHRKTSMMASGTLNPFNLTASSKNSKVIKKKNEHVEELIEDYRQEFWHKTPFEKAEFHQCIPNPEKPGEMITIQLVTQ